MIKFETVSKSYSGKPGCACGCRGTHRVASHYGVAAANADSGYDAYDRTSDRSVKSTLSKVNKLIDWTDPDSVAEHVLDDFAWADSEDGNRTYTVYFVSEDYGKLVRMAAAEAAVISATETAARRWASVE